MIDNIVSRIYQLLTQEFEQHGPRRRSFHEEVAVARLAIELARLHGTRSPEQHLPEAVQLLTNARWAMTYERQRPERVQKAIEQQIQDSLEASRQAHQVPWAQLVRKKGEPKTKAPYTEHGFRKLFKKYVAETYQNASDRLQEALTENPPNYKHAESILVACWHDDADLKACRDVNTTEDAKAFVQRWRNASEPAAFKYLFEQAKAGRLTQADVAAIYRTRDRVNRAKTEKATAVASAKRKSRDDGMKKK